MAPAFPKLNANDVTICRGFQALIKQGKFEIQGAAVARSGLLFKWFEELDKRIEETLRVEPKVKPKRKEIGEAEKKG